MIGTSQIQAQLEQHRSEFPFPGAIAGMDVQVGRDSTGDQAVWVWVVIHDEQVEQVWPLTTRDDLREQIRTIIERVFAPDDVLVYVRFRAASEHRALVGEEWPG